MSDSDSSEGEMGGMFTEPAEFNPPPPEATFEIFTRAATNKQPQEMKLRLVGSHPLWAHHLWNAAKVFANWMDDHPQYTVGKNVLEIGAGAALPSFVAAVNGATKVNSFRTKRRKIELFFLLCSILEGSEVLCTCQQHRF